MSSKKNISKYKSSQFIGTEFQHSGNEYSSVPHSFHPQHPPCYAQPIWGWGSCDQFKMHQSVPLPPALPPVRTPCYLPVPGVHLPQTETPLRRWGNAYPLLLTHDIRTSSQRSRRFLSRGDVGSTQQLPPAPSLDRVPVQCWQSCFNIAGSARSSLVCVFCKSNREPPEVYTSHLLKDGSGIITCPILRKYKCRNCGATGDFAHTDSYCPQNPNRGAHSSMKSVLNTRVMSSGKKRAEPQ